MLSLLFFLCLLFLLLVVAVEGTVEAEVVGSVETSFPTGPVEAEAATTVLATTADFAAAAAVVPVLVGVVGVGVIVVDAIVVVVTSAVDDTDDLFVADLDLDLDFVDVNLPVDDFVEFVVEFDIILVFVSVIIPNDAKEGKLPLVVLSALILICFLLPISSSLFASPSALLVVVVLSTSTV